MLNIIEHSNYNEANIYSQWRSVILPFVVYVIDIYIICLLQNLIEIQ